eukprot:3603038-Heterocapsa_arctica.AAC.1
MSPLSGSQPEQRRALPWRLVSFNCQNTGSRGRLHDILPLFNASAIMLQSTGVHAPFDGEDYRLLEHVQVGKYDLYRLPWLRADATTNKSCGVSILLNIKFCFRRYTSVKPGMRQRVFMDVQEPFEYVTEAYMITSSSASTIHHTLPPRLTKMLYESSI